MLFFGSPAQAFINPGFTPSNLVKGADLILGGTLEAKGEGTWVLQGAKALKGSQDTPLEVSVAAGDTSGFVTSVGSGEFALAIRGKDESGKKSAFVFVGGRWFDCAIQGGGWQIKSYNQNLGGTYAGDAIMLERMMARLIAEPKTVIPSSAGFSWYAAPVIGKVGGIRQMVVIRGGEASSPLLLVAAKDGDRLFSVTGKNKFADLTESSGLTGSSQFLAVVDAEGTGRDSVVSWNGEEILLRTFDGTTFGEPRSLHKTSQCLGLSAISVNGKRGVLVATENEPLLLLHAGAEQWETLALKGDVPLAGAAGPCLVADFLNDGHPDILQLAADGARLWQGGAKGFAPAKALPIAAGKLPRATLGDYDSDGWLDFYFNGGDKQALWENDGQGGFTDVTEKAGWLASKAKLGADVVFTADFNHSHFPDIGLLFSNMPMQYFFNRGFRSFAEEGQVKLDDLPPSGGPVAAVVADFNGDGSGDLALGTNEGDVQVFFNELYDVPALRIMAAPTSINGPLTVKVYAGEISPSQFLGAFSVVPGGPGTLVTLETESNIILDWREGAEQHQTTIKPSQIQTTQIVLTDSKQ